MGNDFQMDFLDELTKAWKLAETETVEFEGSSGKRNPQTISELSEIISLLYRSACCFWGCPGGDHIIERLIAKSVNQAISAFQLYRACFYDESLMVTRGIGEIANLLRLFHHFPERIDQWRNQTEKQRDRNFQPFKIRKDLRDGGYLIPIDDDRYGMLCGVGTHPSPLEVPGHFTGTGIPILGMIVQPIGAYVSMTELSYATGLVAVVTPKLIMLDSDISKQIKDLGVHLIRNLGGIHILNYGEKINEAKKAKPDSKHFET